MSIETNEGGLSFDARINLTQLEQDADKAVKIVSDAVEKASKKEQELLGKISGGRKAAVQDAVEALSQLSPAMQKNIAIVQSFQKELNSVSSAQKEVEKAFKKGVITQKEYDQAMQGLNVRQAEINENIRKYADQLNYRSQLENAAAGSIRSYQIQVTALKTEFDGLSEAQRQNANVGGKIASQIIDMEKKITKAKEALVEIKEPIVAAFGSIDSLNQKLQTLTTQYTALSQAKRNDPEIGGKLQKEIVATENQVAAINKANQAMRANAAILNASNGSIDQKRLKLQQLTAQYNALTASERENGRVGGKLAQEIRVLDKEINKLNGSLGSAAKSSRIFNQIALATAGLFTINQAGRFANDIIKVRGELEQLEIAFTTILKSKQAADNLLSEVVQLAIRTPFKITELADGAKQLLAYGFAASEVREELIRIGNVASGTGSTFQEVAYAYGTLKSQGRAFARDIRQFTGRGIPIVAELAKQLEVSEQRVNELVSAGKIGFPEVQKAFQGMTSEGGVFFNLMQEQSKSVTGQLSNLKDSIELMFNSIGEGNEGFIKSGISGLKDLVDNYERVVEVLQVAVVLYGSYRAALLLTVAAQKLAAVSSGTMTAATILQNAQTAIATRLTALWGLALNALPIVALTATIGLLVAGVIAWNQSVDGAISAAKNLKEIQDNAAISAEKERSNISELVSILKSEVASLEQKESAYKSLQSILGPYLDGLSREEIAAGKATTAISNYTEALQKNAAVKEAFAKYNELGDQILELEQKGGDALGIFQRIGLEMRESLNFKGKSFGEIIKDQVYISADDLAQRQIKNLKTWREELKSTFDFTEQNLSKNGEAPGKVGFDALIDNTSQYFETLIKIATDKSQFDKIKEGLQEQLEALAPNDPQIAELKKKIQRVNEVLKSYSLTDENKAIKDSAKDRKKVLDDISKLEDEAFKDSFSKREQEIAAARKQFADLREEAKKAGLGGGVITRIDRLEEKTTGNIEYRDETTKLKEELEKRKALYRDFDAFALTFGIQAAEERYSGELDIAQTYLGRIQEEFEKISVIAPENRTGVQKERFELLEKELRDEKKFQQQKYDDFLATVQSYEQERAQLIEIYVLRRQEMIEKGDTEYLAQLDENHKQEIGALDDANFQKLKVYQTFFNGLENLSVKSAKGLIKDLRNILNSALKAGTITQEFYDNLSLELDKADNQTAKRIPENLRQIAQGFRSIAQEVGGTNTALGRMLGILGDSLDRVAAIKSGIADFESAKKSGDVLGAATAGLGVVGSAIGIVSSIVGIIQAGQKKQIEFQKKQLELQRQIYFGELDINRLQRERALANAEIEESTLRSLLAQKDILEQNIAKVREDVEGIESKFGRKLGQNTLDYINSYLSQRRDDFENLLLELPGLLYDTGETKTQNGGFMGLSKKTVKIFKDLSGLSFDEIEKLSLKGQLTEPAEKLFQELKKLKEEGIEVENQLKEIDDALKAIFTGNQTALDIADTLISGFQQGKRAVEDFGADVEEILRNAILSGFKYRFLEEPLNALLEQLYNDAVSDDDLSASEVENFQNQIGKIIEQYGKVFDEIAASTGIDLTGQLGGATQQKGLSGAIRREMTEETAGELAGLWRGQFDISKRHFQVAQDQLGLQIRIEQNTFMTVQELKLAVSNLDKIAKNTDPASARGSGLDG